MVVFGSPPYQVWNIPYSGGDPKSRIPLKKVNCEPCIFLTDLRKNHQDSPVLEVYFLTNVFQ